MIYLMIQPAAGEASVQVRPVCLTVRDLSGSDYCRSTGGMLSRPPHQRQVVNATVASFQVSHSSLLTGNQ